MRVGAVGCGIAGVLAGGVFLVVLLPARALLPLAEGIDGLKVRSIGGRWWQGEAEVRWRDVALGRLAWQWAPAGLLAGELRFDWQIEGAGHALAGRVGCGRDSLAVSAVGKAAAAIVNPALATYDIRFGDGAQGPGEFTVVGLRVRLDGGRGTAAGALRWSGGRVRYRLGAKLLAADLPAMGGVLDVVDGEPALAVATTAGEPLFDLRLGADGWVHVALTKRFVDMAGNPWPGSSEADAVVVEVSRSLGVAEGVPLWGAFALRSTAGLCGMA